MRGKISLKPKNLQDTKRKGVGLAMITLDYMQLTSRAWLISLTTRRPGPELDHSGSGPWNHHKSGVVCTT